MTHDNTSVPNNREPIGSYTDDPESNARHSADIMANRSEVQADGAEQWAKIAEILRAAGNVKAAGRASSAAKEVRRWAAIAVAVVLGALVFLAFGDMYFHFISIPLLDDRLVDHGHLR